MNPHVWPIRNQKNEIDPTFGLMAYKHPALMEDLWVIVWKDSEEQVLGTGAFMDKESARQHAVSNRQQFIDDATERALLV